MAPKGLLERLNDGEKVVVAEGYLFNFEKRGYLQAGPFVPTVVLDHPELVAQLHEEFVRAGSDVVQALTYYANREKLALVDREADLEKLNRNALRIAKGVAEKTNTLLAGNICNTNLHNIEDPGVKERVKEMFKEQLDLMLEVGVDFIIAETFFSVAEALVAVETIKEYGKGIPSVVTLFAHLHDDEEGRKLTVDNIELSEAIKKLEAAGADVVGLNCANGPETILSYIEIIKNSGVKVHLACVPVPYRTTPKEPTIMELTDAVTSKHVFPNNLECVQCSRDDIYNFGRRCDELGLSYIGLCCGNTAAYTRTLCESIGRRPPASKFSPRMEVHAIFGKDEKVFKNHCKNTLEYMATRPLI